MMSINQKFRFIIFIDDDPTSNYIHQLVFDNLEIKKTYFFLSANEGLDFLLAQNANKNNETCDLVFVDVNMPVMDGWYFLEKYQDLYKGGKIGNQFLVMLSSDFNHNDFEKSKNYKSIKDFLIKPLSEKTLKKFFEKHSLV